VRRPQKQHVAWLNHRCRHRITRTNSTPLIQ
jgi:hypothetical protein